MTKPINLWAAKNLLRSVWKLGHDLKIKDVGEGLMQFKFSMESQLNWVLNNGLWSFDNHLLLLKRWEKGMMTFTVDFKVVPIWVQVWGLPFDLMNEEAGKDIGGGIGRVLEVDCKAIAADQACFLRIRVELPLDKPIRRGTPVLSPEGVRVQIAFQYERLVGLCFSCGKLGHEAKECLSNVSATTGERLYREWLKVGFRRQTKSGGRNFGAQSGDRDVTSDQAKDPLQTPQQHSTSSSTANLAKLETVTNREKWQVLITELVEGSNSMSNEQPPHQCAMQTDIPEIMQPDILGKNLSTLPITYVEMDEGVNTTDLCEETLADMINNKARASPRDTKKKPSSETRKWKKKECQDDSNTGPKQIQTEIDGHKLVGLKRQRKSSKDEGNTGERKRSKAQTTYSPYIVAGADS
ncbi:uncharacterized protein LOC136063773 [Quercus suber]